MKPRIVENTITRGLGYPAGMLVGNVGATKKKATRGGTKGASGNPKTRKKK